MSEPAILGEALTAYFEDAASKIERRIMMGASATPAADDILDLTDAEFHTKYGVTPDGDLAGDIDDLLPPSRPTIDVACPILEEET